MAARNRVGLLNAAQRVQQAGRNGDTLLAHINPEEARLLDRVTDGASVNPHTGVLEFWDAGSAGDGHGTSGSSNSVSSGGPSASGSGGENAAHGETQGGTAGRDASYGGGWGGDGGGSDGGNGGDSGDINSASPAGVSVGAPAGGGLGLGLGLGSGSLGALSAATSDPDAAPEKGSGLAGIDVTAAAPGVTGFGEGMNPEMGGGLARSDQAGMISAAWGGDLAGRIGRGLISLSPFSQEPALDKATGRFGMSYGVNPGSVLGAVTGVPGLGLAASALGYGNVGIGFTPGSELSRATPSTSAPGSNGGNPNPYAEALGVDSADMQRRGLLNQRRTFTPIRM